MNCVADQLPALIYYHYIGSRKEKKIVIYIFFLNIFIFFCRRGNMGRVGVYINDNRNESHTHLLITLARTTKNGHTKNSTNL